jgi:hypothetical protein
VLLSHFAEEEVSETDRTSDLAGAKRCDQRPRFRDGIALGTGRFKVTGVDLGQAESWVARRECVTSPQHQPDYRWPVIDHDPESAARPEHAMGFRESLLRIR